MNFTTNICILVQNFLILYYILYYRKMELLTNIVANVTNIKQRWLRSVEKAKALRSSVFTVVVRSTIIRGLYCNDYNSLISTNTSRETDTISKIYEKMLLKYLQVINIFCSFSALLNPNHVQENENIIEDNDRNNNIVIITITTDHTIINSKLRTIINNNENDTSRYSY